jgi:predicted ATP-grasp superfamily ATP-dependent carboligase
MHEALQLTAELRPLERPVLIAAFSGWNDNGGAATHALDYLVEHWGAKPLATIDSEHFYDFTVQRPRVHLENDERVIEWPQNRILTARPPGADRDFILLQGVEPHLRWRTFTEMIADVMRESGCETSVTLGAQPAGIPHTRPLPLNLSASHPDFEELFGLRAPASRYQGPTGIVGVMNLHHRSLGWRNASLWALIPHYLTIGPNPNAAISLSRALDSAYGTQTPMESLDTQAEEFLRQVKQAMAQSSDAEAYVRQLEEQYDSNRPPVPRALEQGQSPGELPATDEILSDLERFLRESRGNDS